MAKLREVEATLSEILEKRAQDPAGRREYLDPTPISPPVGFVKPRHIIDDIREMVRTEMSRRAEDGGFDSFEDAEDFDIDDEYDPTTPFEQYFDPTPVGVLRERQQEAQKAVSQNAGTPVAGKTTASPDGSKTQSDANPPPPAPGGIGGTGEEI